MSEPSATAGSERARRSTPGPFATQEPRNYNTVTVATRFALYERNRPPALIAGTLRSQLPRPEDPPSCIENAPVEVGAIGYDASPVAGSSLFATALKTHVSTYTGRGQAFAPMRRKVTRGDLRGSAASHRGGRPRAGACQDRLG